MMITARVLIRILTTPKTTPHGLSSSVTSRFFATSSPFSSSSTSPPPPPSSTATAATATAAADETSEEEGEGEDLLYPGARGFSSYSSAVEPTLLQPRVVVYDGVCHLCHRGVKLVIQADKHRKIKFCCLQSKTAETYLRVSGLDREDVLRRFLFVEGPGLYYQGSTAALKVLSYLPFPYSASSALFILPTPLRDAIYDYIAKRRYDWFGKSNDCLVLNETEMLERFIDRDEIINTRNRSNV